MMSALDYLNFQQDMEDRAALDYELWIMAHEWDYCFLLCMLIVLIEQVSA